MGNYKVCKDIRFRKNGQSDEEIVIKKGSVVCGVSKSQMTLADQLVMKRAEKRISRTNKRYAFFMAYGVVRYATLVDELVPVRRQANVPTV